MNGLAGDLRRELPKDSELVEHPDAAAVGADDEIVVFDREVTKGRRWQVEHQRFPMVAVIEGDIDARLRTGE